jgi:hypothetical protein
MRNFQKSLCSRGCIAIHNPLKMLLKKKKMIRWASYYILYQPNELKTHYTTTTHKLNIKSVIWGHLADLEIIRK